MTLNKSTSIKIVSGFALFSVLVMTTQCKKSFKSDSFSPSNLPQANIKTIDINSGGAFYCSISGGCPITITGDNFFIGAKVFVGPYECLNAVPTPDYKTITCTVGPGQNGVYDISIKNADGQVSKFDVTILDPSVLQMSYASFLYLASQETPGKVYAYAQHPTNGSLLTIVGSPFSVATETSTYGVVIHTNDKFLYAANVGTSTITIYSINPANGRLTTVGTPMASGSAGANGLFFHPTGKYLYVTNFSGNTVSAFSVSETTGLLTALAGSPYATGGATTINGVVVSNDGKFLFAASQGGSGGVVAYTINSLDGTLTLIPGSPFINTMGGVVTNPGDGITIHPNSKWLYMGLAGLRKVSAWSIDSTTGSLTPIEAPILNNSTTGYVDSAGSASTVSKDGLFLYSTAFSNTALDPKKVITYSIDQTTGGLTRSSEANTTGGPNDVRIDTTGNFAYTCDTKNPAAVSAFSVNKITGMLTPLAVPSYSIPAPAGGPGIMVMQRN
jgi:6-phosphogluconolactonase (cycloisomerase 2 family)